MSHEFNVMKSSAVVIESPKTDSRIFAHTRWDALPVPGRNFPLLLFLRDVLSLPAGSTLDHAHSWLHLLGEHFMEYQWHFAQLHSQSLLSIAIAKPAVQYS